MAKKTRTYDEVTTELDTVLDQIVEVEDKLAEIDGTTEALIYDLPDQFVDVIRDAIRKFVTNEFKTQTKELERQLTKLRKQEDKLYDEQFNVRETVEMETL